MRPPLSSSLLILALLLTTSHASQLYHQTNDLVEILRRQATICPYARPQWLSLKHTSFSYFLQHPPQGRLLMITVSPYAKSQTTLTRPRYAKTPDTTLVAVFGEHPRERITTELALEILRRYCHSPPTWAVFVLIPIVNLLARHRVDAGVTCQRLNHRSVDLNRNYPQSWGRTDRDTVLEEEKPGIRPLSEFETAAIDALVRRLRPAAYISVHSGDTAVLVPWDSGEPVDGWVAHVANMVRQKHCPLCRIGSSRTLFGYRAYGTGVDHMFGVRQVPFACTLEIYGGPRDDCNLMFNPDNRSVLVRVLKNWSGVLETVAKEVAGQAAASSSWYDFLLPRGYLVSIIENDGDEAAMQAVPTHTVLVVAIASIAVIVVRKGLTSTSRSVVGRMTSRWFSRIEVKSAFLGRSRQAVQEKWRGRN